jgi:hypothetical protein
MDQDTKFKNILFFAFLGIWVLTALGTLSMLFLGFGEVKDEERTILITSFLVETAAAIGALFYSLWEIKKKENEKKEEAKEFFINPLDEAFKDKVIPMEVLKLPTLQLHENKHFKRCKFVGPSAVVVLGGNWIRTGFLECGDVIILPDNVKLSGVTVLKNCTVEECEFIRVTIFCDKNTAHGFASIPGSTVKGLA